MARAQVMKLWTVIVTAFLALCTALGLGKPAAAAPVPQAEVPRKSAPLRWAWSFVRSLPPTMKQRIRAEAHGSSPGCRHRSPTAQDEDGIRLPARESLAAALTGRHAFP
ncbi:DUF6344 domain-containing protein [Streptomyces cavernae]|uniref:DUF6344 domain-containing protein n=1 Tax=Streptomyces cavernae TaxID=2259034 RepID=UPI001EE41E5D|nr:DUF6344 domain-containing protein [Streptomyces cavernae]